MNDMASTDVPSPKHAVLELSLLNAESCSTRFDELATRLLDRGLPAEVVTRLAALWERTEIVAGEVISVGRIILGKIIDFIEANPLIAAGVALGAAFAALAASVPLLGPLLAPFLTPVAIAGGGAVGANMQRGHDNGSLVHGLVDVANAFFALLIGIFRAVSEYWGSRRPASA